MVLTYLGVACSQADLARQLGTRPYVGTPQANIERLRSLGLDVVYRVLDPAMTPEPLTVPLGDFMLAWDEVDNAYAAISLRK